MKYSFSGISYDAALRTEMGNRLPDSNDKPAAKVVVVQTPLGLLQIALPPMPAMPNGDPLKIAMDTFQNAVDEGVADPLQITLVKLKAMADGGVAQPLTVGLAILQKMSESGMLPPMAILVEGTGIDPTQYSTTQAPAAETGVLKKIEQVYLN